MLSLTKRILDQHRGRKGIPTPEDVIVCFFDELLSPFGRIGLWLEASLKSANTAKHRAILEELSERNGVGAEALTQSLSMKSKVVETCLHDLYHGGFVKLRGRNFLPANPWLTLRFLASRRFGETQKDFSKLKDLFLQFRNSEGSTYSTENKELEDRIQKLLGELHGRRLPGLDFGTRDAVLVPSHPQWEAVVGHDTRNHQNHSQLIAMDLMLNGRDRRWILEFPPSRDILDRETYLDIRNRYQYFCKSSRRTLHRLWIVHGPGFSREVEKMAREDGVLLSNKQNVSSLEGSYLSGMAA